MNQKISKTLSLLTCLAIMASFATRVEAQNPKNPAKAPAMQSAVYCNQVAELYGKDLQERANKECRTVYPCIPCTQQETGAKTCMQLTIQPSQESKCRATVKISDPKTGLSAPASESTAFRYPSFRSHVFMMA